MDGNLRHPAPVREKWEYKVLYDLRVELLNTFGNDGWEMVGIATFSTGGGVSIGGLGGESYKVSTMYAFKRALLASEMPALGEFLRKCPFCAEHIKCEASVCRYCQRDVPVDIEYSVKLERQTRIAAYVPESTAVVDQNPVDSREAATCPNCFQLVALGSTICSRCKSVL